MRKNIAVILAGGSGSRMGLNQPKQFLTLAGKTILEHSVSTFQAVDEINEIVIVSSPQYHEYVQNICHPFSKVKKILNSGKERYHSTLSAVQAYEGQENINLLIHDAARPLVSIRIIKDCIHALKQHPAVGTGLPATDTLIEVTQKTLQSIPPREHYWHAQTPQCFHLEVLNTAFTHALANPNFHPTDDCSVVYRYCPETKIHLILGDEKNKKLTHLDDIIILESFLHAMKAN